MYSVDGIICSSTCERKDAWCGTKTGSDNANPSMTTKRAKGPQRRRTSSSSRSWRMRRKPRIRGIDSASRHDSKFRLSSPACPQRCTPRPLTYPPYIRYGHIVSRPYTIGFALADFRLSPFGFMYHVFAPLPFHPTPSQNSPHPFLHFSAFFFLFPSA